MFPGQYLENEWLEDTTITQFFDVESRGLSIQEASR